MPRQHEELPASCLFFDPARFPSGSHIHVQDGGTKRLSTCGSGNQGFSVRAQANRLHRLGLRQSRQFLRKGQDDGQEIVCVQFGVARPRKARSKGGRTHPEHLSGRREDGRLASARSHVEGEKTHCCSKAVSVRKEPFAGIVKLRPPSRSWMVTSASSTETLSTPAKSGGMSTIRVM